MGVTYKLTEDIVQFILQQKNSMPSLSCRELVERVATQFQKEVSKSSVHEVLKQANIVSPRGRKAKSKFQIPQEKKAVLFGQTAMLPEPDALKAIPLLPDVVKKAAPEAIPLPPPPKPNPKTLKTLVLEDNSVSLGDVLTQLAGYDLGIKDTNDDWSYLITQIGAFKFELEDGCVFYVDSRFQSTLGSSNPAQFQSVGIERCLGEMADILINNMQTIVIKEVMGEHLEASFFDAIACFEGKKGKSISKLSLVDLKAQPLAEFEGVLNQKRTFVIGISTQVIDIKQLLTFKDEDVQAVPSYFSDQPILYVSQELVLGGVRLRAFLILDDERKPQRAIVSNCASLIADGDIVRAYAGRHPVYLPAVSRWVDLGPKDPIEYARQMFFSDISDEKWASVLSLKAKIEKNDDVQIITILLPYTYDNFVQIVKALQIINSLGLKDPHGRQIHIKSLTQSS